MAAILIIDPSPTIRETLRIVLGGEHAVSVASSWDEISGAPPALVILGAPPPPRAAAAGAVRARVAPNAPLLLLNGADEVDLRALAPAGHRVEFLPKPFDVHALRARVRALLAPLPRRIPTEATVVHHRRWIEPPLLTSGAAALARRATVADLPVLLIGERGTGVTEVARAIHFFAGGGGRVVARSARDIGMRLLTPDDGGGDAPGAVVIEDVHLLSRDAQHVLLASLRDPDETKPSIRVFATTDADLETCAASGAFAPELAYVLGVLPVFLAPLRERTADIPSLVEALTRPLTARLRLESITFTDAALERLQRYLWFGNVVELETVLARTLAVHRPRIVEPQMLEFTAGDPARALEPTEATYAPSAPPTGAAPSAASTAAPSTLSAPSPVAARARVLPLERRRSDEPAPSAIVDRPSVAMSGRPLQSPATERRAGADTEGAGDSNVTTSGPSLEVLLGELAHELRNPMVTIKTFAQHLDSVLDDAEVRTRFASLTGEAIARMDTLLETLLDFARFRVPLRQRVDLAALLVRALDERAEDLARKDVRLEHVARAAGPFVVEADEAQMLFAFRSLVDGLVHDLMSHAPVRIATGDDGTLEVTVHADRAIAARLAAYVADAERDGETAPPLAFALAAALIRRNHGRLGIRASDDGATIITVTIPRTVAHGER
ncbi:MAG: hypothetical protein HY271_11025 [Deltaproteobacteria bacterium]|nr:hypothetical protein [Deltaproteobacteria bacterium]